MKRGMLTLILLLLLVSPIILAQEDTTEVQEETSAEENKVITQFKENPWNETITISPAWQTLLGGFFGLNLHNEKTDITVTESIIFFMVFVMFFAIILDIIKVLSIFTTKLGSLSIEVPLALVVTILVSISGAFINLKNLFISGIAYTITKLDWKWMSSRGWTTFAGAVVIIIAIILIHQILSWISPLLKKYSKISRAEAKGRAFGGVLTKADSSAD